jgi:membrane protein YdbS with pleckstrin-like domain
LTNNEEVLLEAKRHWLSLLPAFAYTIVFFVLLLTMSFFASFVPQYPWAGLGIKIVILIVALSFLFHALSDYVTYFSTELCFTEKRLIGKVGFLKVRTLLTPLNKINHVSASNGLLGSLFHFGNIQIHTSSGQVVYRQIIGHLDFANALMEQMVVYQREMTAADDPSARFAPVSGRHAAVYDDKQRRKERVDAKPDDAPPTPPQRLAVRADFAKTGAPPPLKLEKQPEKSRDNSPDKPQDKTQDKPQDKSQDKSREKTQVPAGGEAQLYINCPKCNSVYYYKKEQAGRSTACRKCGQVISVPKN